MLEIDVLGDKSENIHYNLPGVPIFINKTMLSVDYDLAVECHWHDDIEFILITHGQLNYNINGECITLKQGEGVFINSKQMHYGFSVGNNVCECVCVIFHPSLICPNEFVELNFINPIIHNNKFSYAVLSPDISWTAEIFNIINDINDTYSEKGIKSILNIQSYFYNIWSLLYDNMPQGNDSEQYLTFQLFVLKEMVSFIHSHYTEKISLSDIAAVGNMCQNKCYTLFRKYLHQTPNNYLTIHRLRKSTQLLTDTSMSMTEIADYVGFAGSSYFAEIFRKHFKCSPSEYRKELGR